MSDTLQYLRNFPGRTWSDVTIEAVRDNNNIAVGAVVVELCVVDGANAEISIVIAILFLVIGNNIVVCVACCFNRVILCHAAR